MKSSFLKTFIIFVFGLSLISAKAQNNLNWELATLNVHDGTNSWNGVQGFYALSTCNGAPRVFVKLINTNAYTVKAGWKTCVLIKGDDQRHPANYAQDSVTIPAKSEVAGACGGKNPQLVLDLSNFGTDAEDFNGLITPDFDFIVIH